MVVHLPVRSDHLPLSRGVLRRCCSLVRFQNGVANWAFKLSVLKPLHVFPLFWMNSLSDWYWLMLVHDITAALTPWCITQVPCFFINFVKRQGFTASFGDAVYEALGGLLYKLLVSQRSAIVQWGYLLLYQIQPWKSIGTYRLKKLISRRKQPHIMKMVPWVLDRMARCSYPPKTRLCSATPAIVEAFDSAVVLLCGHSIDHCF